MELPYSSTLEEYITRLKSYTQLREDKQLSEEGFMRLVRLEHTLNHKVSAPSRDANQQLIEQLEGYIQGYNEERITKESLATLFFVAMSNRKVG